MKEYVFTIVVDFEGTTSVAQLSAKHRWEAISKWHDQLGDGGARGLAPEQANRLLDAFDPTDERFLVALNTLKNVWYWGSSTDSLAMFNVILTSSETCPAWPAPDR